MIRSIFGEISKPKEIRIGELNIILIFSESDGEGMEHYYFEDGEEFAFSRNREGGIAVVNIYSPEVLSRFL